MLNSLNVIMRFQSDREPGAFPTREADSTSPAHVKLTNLTEAELCLPGDSSAICFDVLTSSEKLTEDLFHLLRREKHAHFKAHC